MNDWKRVNDGFKMMLKKSVVVSLKVLSCNRTEGRRKTMKSFRDDSWCPDRTSNQEYLHYRSDELPLKPICWVPSDLQDPLVWGLRKKNGWKGILQFGAQTEVDGAFQFGVPGFVTLLDEFAARVH
jgi:hypothetical protein